MERTGFEYKVSATVRLTHPEVEHLAYQASRYYDGKCRALVPPGPGAVLNRMRNSFFDTNGEPSEHAEVELSLREMNLLLKVLEMPDSDRDLFNAIFKAFCETRSEEERLYKMREEIRTPPTPEAVEFIACKGPSWSRPYYGVQHFNGIPRAYQITVNDLGTCAEVYLLDWTKRLQGFTAQRQKTLATAEEARAVGEKWAKELDPNAKPWWR